MNFPECFNKAHLNSSFGGVEMSQTWNDLALWEEFFNRANVKSVLELGTYRGGMTMFFTLQGIARGVLSDEAKVSDDSDKDEQRRRFSVTTVDHQGHGAPVELLQKLGATLLTMDLLSEATLEPMRKLIATLPKPLVMFVDNGNKPREWQLYVPLLSPGDFAAVHDWGSEFHEHNLDPYPTPFLQAECESIESMTRFFQI